MMNTHPHRICYCIFHRLHFAGTLLAETAHDGSYINAQETFREHCFGSGHRFACERLIAPVAISSALCVDQAAYFACKLESRFIKSDDRAY